MFTVAAQTNTLPPSGNVGIGTTTPSSRLQVNGTAKIDSSLIVKDSVTIKKNLRVEENVNFLGQTKMNNTRVFNNFVSDNSAKFNGVVKMPNLELPATLNNKNVVLTNTNGALKIFPLDSLINFVQRGLYVPPVQLDFYCANIAPVAPTWSNGPYKIYSHCQDVNVGIATNEPRVNLDVRGTTFTERIAINSDPTTMGYKLFHLKANYTHPSQASKVLFLVENHERALFQISNDGIVRTREVIVNLDQSWPDYVFTPEYKLTPLKEVASFIKENGHLPNVPSAETIKENGIQLGEMNRVLLEKVEELTLHLIEQQKQLDAQQKRIVELEKLNK